MRKHTKDDLIEILNRRKGKSGNFGVPILNGKKNYKGMMIDYVMHQQSNNPKKYFVLELIKFPWGEKPELRIGYYILGRQRSVVGKWRWGQSAPCIPLKDIDAIFKKAKKLVKGYNNFLV